MYHNYNMLQSQSFDGKWRCRGCLVPCKRKVAGSNLPQATAYCIATLDKLLNHNCLWGRQRGTTSFISSPGGIKANGPAFGQRTVTTTAAVVDVVIIIIIIIIIITMPQLQSSTASVYYYYSVLQLQIIVMTR